MSEVSKPTGNPNRSAEEMQQVVARASEAALQAGASQADVLLVEGDDREVRVRGEEIEFVKQAQERGLGIRALVDGKEGRQTSIVSTSDLAPDAVVRMAEEAVALARSTAADPTAGLPEDGFATDLPDLGLFNRKRLRKSHPGNFRRHRLGFRFAA